MQEADRVAAPLPGLGLSCPRCGGLLRPQPGARPPRFLCPEGDALSPPEVLRRLSERMRASLEAALRLGREKAALLQRIAEHARRNGCPGVAASFERDVEALEARSRILEAALRPVARRIV